jgi:AAA15 family ATPase/GTPase
MNYINNIKLENFKCFKKIEVNDFVQINILVGKNNSGKSCLLEGLFFLEGAKRPITIVQQQMVRGINEPENLESLKYIFNDLQIDQSINISGEIAEKPRSVKMNLLKAQTETIDTETTSTLKTDEFKVAELSIVVNEQDKTINCGLKLNDQGKIVATNASEKTILISYRGTIQHRNENVKSFQKVVDNKEKDSILKVLQYIDKNIIDIEIGSNGISLNIAGKESLFPLAIYGEGMKKIVNLLSELAASEEAVFCIDELENGLHFSSFKQLWIAVLTIVKQKNHQLFITTHNEELIQSLIEDVLPTLTFEDMKEYVAIYTIDRKEDIHKAYRYSYSQALAAIDNNFELRR